MVKVVPWQQLIRDTSRVGRVKRVTQFYPPFLIMAWVKLGKTFG